MADDTERKKPLPRAMTGAIPSPQEDIENATPFNPDDEQDLKKDGGHASPPKQPDANQTDK